MATNNVRNYAQNGKTGETRIIAVKTFTVKSGYIFKTPPTVDFSMVKNRRSYSFTVKDTGSIQTGDLTKRKITVKYKQPKNPDKNDCIKFIAKAERIQAASTGKIYNYSVTGGGSRSDDGVDQIGHQGEQRTLTVWGDPGERFTRVCTDGVASSETKTIPSTGKYVETFSFPAAVGASVPVLTLTETVSGQFVGAISSPSTYTFRRYGRITITLTVNRTDSDYTIASGSTYTSIGNAQGIVDNKIYLNAVVNCSTNLSADGTFTIADFKHGTEGYPSLGESGSQVMTLPDNTLIRCTDLKIVFDNSGGTKTATITGTLYVNRGTSDQTITLTVDDIINHA